jgi:type I restriction enzyme S subunit
MEGRKVPEIRFEGFEGEWEEYKLGEIVEIVSRTNEQSNAPVMMITAQNGFINQSERYVYDNTGESLKKYILLRRDELAYNHGASKIRPYGSCFALNVEEARVPFVYHCFSVGKNVSEFISFVLNGRETEKQLKKMVSSGARMDGLLNISFEEFCSISLMIPTVVEQKRVARYFRNLDGMLTFYQYKLEKLKLLKRAMIEKMFPKNGEKVPEIRFEGFTDDWEQRKAGDIAEYSKGNGYSKSDLTESGTPIILYGRLYTKYQFVINEVDTFAVPKEGAVYSEGNEVIVPASGETAEDIARASAVEKPGVLLGGDLNILHPFDFINPLFLALAISNGEPQKELAKRAQGKSVVHIHNSDIQELCISYPTRTEQDKIIAVFRNLDNLITLHQDKIEKLHNFKKSMLEKMFI